MLPAKQWTVKYLAKTMKGEKEQCTSLDFAVAGGLLRSAGNGLQNPVLKGTIGSALSLPPA